MQIIVIFGLLENCPFTPDVTFLVKPNIVKIIRDILKMLSKFISVCVRVWIIACVCVCVRDRERAD